MKSLLKKWISKTGYVSNKALFHRFDAEFKDVKALALLPDLQAGYLPWSSFAIRPSALALILNDVVINKRRTIIECGVGLSTLHMLCDHVSRETRVIGIDEDANWIRLVESYLDKMNVSRDRYSFVHAPMGSYAGPEGQSVWYDNQKIQEAVDVFLNGDKADMLVVDGPKGFLGDRVRYPALPRLHAFLNSDCSIFLDDIHRSDEYLIAQMWADEFDLELVYYLNAGDIALLRPGSGPSSGVIKL